MIRYSKLINGITTRLNPYPAVMMVLLITSSPFQLNKSSEKASNIIMPERAPTLDKNNNQRICEFRVK
ncbi:MAG TPA: hypothetical protein PKY86_07525 [Niabella sp.]|nr:hypothetical protein [Niabella sp.]HRB36843.1 hypothetical protein [Niabella sp.]HRB47293.1 hypothetical protein [Niabella sp.]HRB64497.1 hypothetical protein [Niabella sp.]HRB80044.1 hypothetical protein [Niabella sp.]